MSVHSSDELVARARAETVVLRAQAAVALAGRSGELTTGAGQLRFHDWMD